MIVYTPKGKSKAGAPMYTGRWTKPPIWLGVGCVLMFGTILISFGNANNHWHKPLKHYLFSPDVDHWFLIVHDLLFIPFAVLLGLTGIWMLKTRYQMRHLQTTDQICTQFGMGDDVFHAWREEQTIKPHININGTDYYRPADFVDAGTLLRASAQPVTPETLLRPGMYAETAAPEQLLRAKV